VSTTKKRRPDDKRFVDGANEAVFVKIVDLPTKRPKPRLRVLRGSQARGDSSDAKS
jgi:hypothetical protein